MTEPIDARHGFIKGEPQEEELSFDTGMKYYNQSEQGSGDGQPLGGISHSHLHVIGSHRVPTQQTYQSSSRSTNGFDGQYRSLGSHSHLNSSLSSSLIQDDELLAYINLDPTSPDLADTASDRVNFEGEAGRSFSIAGGGRQSQANPTKLSSEPSRWFNTRQQLSVMNDQVSGLLRPAMSHDASSRPGRIGPYGETPIGSWKSQNPTLSYHHTDMLGHSSTSQSHSPMTPKTPAAVLGGLPMSAPAAQQHELAAIRSRYIQAQAIPTQTGPWDGRGCSFNSYIDSPLSSPGYSIHHPPLSEMVLKVEEHTSLPSARIVAERGTRIATVAAQAEQKRKRRRESHNQVERRRRDNINERIQELSHLIPHHRLEDDRIRKHLQSGSPLSPPSLIPNLSPTFADAQLISNSLRRANLGPVSTGIPQDEKEKGPNKGDILNGSVAWTRDLMWCLHTKLDQEQVLRAVLARYGEAWPFPPSEAEDRLRAELVDVMKENGGFDTFSYSRGPGSGLRVPSHTHLDGTPLASDGLAMNAHVSAARSPSQQIFWTEDNLMHEEFELKEEDGYGAMEVGGL